MKRLIVLMLCIFLILSSCGKYDPALPPDVEPHAASVCEQDVFPSENYPIVPFRYGRSLMEGGMAELYDRIWTFLSQPESLDNIIPVDENLTDSEIAYTVNVFRRENPIFYWADFSIEGKYIFVTAKITPDEILRQRQAIEARALEILEPLVDASPFEKALAIHDALAVIPYSSNESRLDRDNIYGTLVNRAALCGGYASSFLYLTELAGLNSVFIAGESERGISHAWNAVYLDGSWHFVDVTWNRPGRKFDEVNHAYFLINTETLKKGRYWDENQYSVMPEEGDSFRDYYQRMGYSVSRDTPFNAVEIMADIFYRQILERQSYTQGAKPVYLELGVSDSSSIYDKWKSLFIKHLFDILEMIQTRAHNENADFIVAEPNRISLDYDDVAQVLVFYPIIKEK